MSLLKEGWMGGWGQGAGTVEQMGLEDPWGGEAEGGGGAPENLELLQSCELKHSSHSRLLYCSDEPRRDKNVSDFFKKPHTYTNARPVSTARPSLAHLLPGGGKERALGVAPHSGHLSLGTQMAQAMVEGLKGKALPCPTAHISAGLILVSDTPHLHSELGGASLSPAATGAQHLWSSLSTYRSRN